MRQWYDVAVFTRDGLGGNQLAVFTDATGISAQRMQQTAAAIGYPETVFLDWPERSEPPPVRIFTPGVELRFAGHPLVGTAWLLEHIGTGNGRGGGPDAIEPPVGRIRCGASAAKAWIECPRGRKEPVADVAAVAAALRVRRRSIASIWCGGVAEDQIAVEVSDVAELDPDMGALAALGCLVGCFTRRGRDRADRFDVRCFAPGAGVDEDPATGSFAVTLASVLGRTVVIDQGDALGRPSRLAAELLADSGVVRLSGACALLGVRQIDD